MTIRIVADSTCDLSPEQAQASGITILPLYINAGRQGYRDGVDISREEFYTRLPEWRESPTTAAPSPQVFCETYQQVAEQYGADEILSLHISISLSATVDVARVAAQQCQDVPVTVFDSRQLSLGTGFLALNAARAANEGASMPELIGLLNEQISRTHVFAALDTLEYLRRSGRMHWAMARIGEILRIKPILRMYEGEPTVHKVRTQRAAMARMVQWLEEIGEFDELALVHTHAPDKALVLRELAAHVLPTGELPMANVTPVLGAHLGPGAVGVACVQAR